MEHLLKLAFSSSRSTIGAVTRAWTIVIGITAVPVSFLIISDEWSRHGAAMLERVPNMIGVGIAVGILFSIPVMAVLAIWHVCRNW